MRILPPAVGLASLVVLLTAAGPVQASTDLACILNVDTGVMSCSDRAAATPMASNYLLATLYTNANYGGSSLALQGATPCDTNSDVDHAWASLPTGFADEISSFKGSNDCQVKLFENINFTGSTVGPATSMSYVGDAMNDKASSVQLS